MVMPTEDRYSKTRNQLLDNLAYAMGGRVAEEVVFGDPSTGASNDISQATEIARQMVTEYGMAPKVGSVRLAGSSGEVFLGRDMGHGREYSEEVAATVDVEVRTLMDNAMAEATAALTANRKVLDALADQLLERRPSTSPNSPCSLPRSRRRPSARVGRVGTGRPSPLAPARPRGPRLARSSPRTFSQLSLPRTAWAKGQRGPTGPKDAV